MTPWPYFIDLWNKKNVTFRVHGDKKQYRKPMVHRFEVNGGVTIREAFVANLTRGLPLFDRLRKRNNVKRDAQAS